MAVPRDAHQQITREAERIAAGYGPESLAIFLRRIGEARPDVARRVLRALTGGGLVRSEEALPPDTPFADTGCRASELLGNQARPQAIFPGLYAAAVVLLAGETNAGKSSGVYNIVLHAAQDLPLWGIPFRLGRPARVWYHDPENALTQAATKIERIGVGWPDTLVIDPAVGADLSRPEHQEGFVARIRRDRFDLVVLDPLANLFGTVNENDNAEAAQQMAFLHRAAKETGACILIVHHTGKGEGSNNAYGRGASARLASADVGMTWRSRSDDDAEDDTIREDQEGVERHDEVRLQIVKNRLGRQGSIYLRMAGQDRFAVSSYAAWRRAMGKAVGSEDRRSKPEQAEEAILEFLADGEFTPRAEIVAHLQSLGVGASNADRILKQLATDGRLETKRGTRNVVLYALADGDDGGIPAEPIMGDEQDDGPSLVPSELSASVEPTGGETADPEQDEETEYDPSEGRFPWHADTEEVEEPS